MVVGALGARAGRQRIGKRIGKRIGQSGGRARADRGHGARADHRLRHAHCRASAGDREGAGRARLHAGQAQERPRGVPLERRVEARRAPLRRRVHAHAPCAGAVPAARRAGDLGGAAPVRADPSLPAHRGPARQREQARAAEIRGSARDPRRRRGVARRDRRRRDARAALRGHPVDARRDLARGHRDPTAKRSRRRRIVARRSSISGRRASDTPEGDEAREITEAYIEQMVETSDTPCTDAEVAAAEATCGCELEITRKAP